MNDKERQEKNVANIKDLITKIMEFYVALDRRDIIQRKIVENFVNDIKAKSLTFNDLRVRIEKGLKNAKTNATKATLAQLYNIIGKHYENVE